MEIDVLMFNMLQTNNTKSCLFSSKKDLKNGFRQGQLQPALKLLGLERAQARLQRRLTCEQSMRLPFTRSSLKAHGGMAGFDQDDFEAFQMAIEF